MTLFVDASAMVAILTGEEGADALADQLAADQELLYSAMSRWEAVIGLHRSHDYDWRYAQSSVDDLVVARAMKLIPIGEMEGQLALNAFGNYGKGRHPAKLNMGDCFAYACAKANAAALLYKGDVCASTDLA